MLTTAYVGLLAALRRVVNGVSIHEALGTAERIGSLIPPETSVESKVLCKSMKLFNDF